MNLVKFAFGLGSAAELAVLVLTLLGLGGVIALFVLRRTFRLQGRARFGDAALVGRLVRGSSPLVRRIKSALLIVGTVAFAAALTRPQAKSGTKLLPATTLDVVIVLDFSKSMYARDVLPDRITRAKLEVAELVKALPGARFGAVAFAGEPMSFPLTSDGAAIAQYFRQINPNDMPVGGTAIARALELARQLLARDPKSKDHERVIVLITDGEDLEGDPVKVAEMCQLEGTRIDVVQIGGRTAEPIPEVDDKGQFVGLRKDRQGKTLTSQLSSAGEAQLSKVASTAGGTLVKSDKGETGLAAITKGLRRKVREELSERAIVVWDELYGYPLALALLLLGLDFAFSERWAAERLAALRVRRAQKKGPHAS